MKNILKFDEMGELSIRDKKNYNTVIEHLCSGWRFSKEIITAVVAAMHGSYDQSDEYLSDMDGYDYEDPADYWKEWCLKHDIEHEIESNPFI